MVTKELEHRIQQLIQTGTILTFMAPILSPRLQTIVLFNAHILVLLVVPTLAPFLPIPMDSTYLIGLQCRVPLGLIHGQYGVNGSIWTTIQYTIWSIVIQYGLQSGIFLYSAIRSIQHPLNQSIWTTIRTTIRTNTWSIRSK